MDNLNNQKVIDANQVFDNRFMETKALYIYHFNILPSVNFISDVDGEKAFIAFKEKYAAFILHVYTYRWYKKQNKKFQFDRTVIILNNNCIIEFDSSYCEILHSNTQEDFLNDLIALVMKCKERKKSQPSEINLIVRDGARLDLKTMEIKKTKLDLDLFYADDFKEVDDVITKEIETKE